MPFKKKLTSFCFLLCSSIAGITYADNSIFPSPFFYRGIYVDVNLGYAAINWERFTPTETYIFNRNGRGGFSFGADTGYQCNRYIAFEGGWYYLPEAKYTVPTDDVNFIVRSWLAYLGLKLSVPVAGQFYLFGKLAASYRSLEFISSPIPVAPNGSHSLWRPAGVIGWQYNITSAWSILMQYMYVPGENSSTPGVAIAPTINLVTVAYAYKFEV